MQRQLASAPFDIESLSPVIKKYINLSTPSDKIKTTRDEHSYAITSSLRRAVSDLPLDHAIEVASRMDGLITILILIAIVDELKFECENTLRLEFGLQTQGVAVKLEKDFEDRLDEILSETPARAVTTDDLNKITHTAMLECWQQLNSQQYASAPMPPTAFIELMKNYVYLIAASKVYHETDALQMANLIDVVNYFSETGKKIRSLTREKIVQPYQALLSGVVNITMTPKTMNRWEELSCWLEGLHNRVYRAIPKEFKDVDGVVLLNEKTKHYPTVDKADKMFLEYKNTTKYEMSLSNLALARRLSGMHRLLTCGGTDKSSLTTTSPILDASYPRPASTAITAASASRASATNLFASTPPTQLSTPGISRPPFTHGSGIQRRSVSVSYPNGTEQGADVTMHLPPEASEKDVLERMKVAMKAVLDPEGCTGADKLILTDILRSVMPEVLGAVAYENVLAQHLAAILDRAEIDKKTKIDHLRSSIERFGLTANQLRSLEHLGTTVRTNFSSYYTDGLFFEKTHSKLAKIKEAEIISCSSPADQLDILFKLRDELDQSKSHALLGKVDAILLSVFNILSVPVKSLETLQQTSVSAAARASRR